MIGDEPWVGINWAGIRTYGAPMLATGERILTTVLFTDIVGSTDVAARIGDGRWQALLASHNDTARRAIDSYSGVEVKTTGDGFLARFDAPARALACARAIRAATSTLGLEIRAAVHTGEVELVGDDIRGLAVHLASRILALAGPGEILASATTRDLSTDPAWSSKTAAATSSRGSSARARCSRSPNRSAGVGSATCSR